MTLQRVCVPRIFWGYNRIDMAHGPKLMIHLQEVEVECASSAAASSSRSSVQRRSSFRSDKVRHHLTGRRRSDGTRRKVVGSTGSVSPGSLCYQTRFTSSGLSECFSRRGKACPELGPAWRLLCSSFLVMTCFLIGG